MNKRYKRFSLLLIMVFMTLSCTRNSQLINDSNSIVYHNIQQNSIYFEKKLTKYMSDSSYIDLFKHSQKVLGLVDQYQQDLYDLDGTNVNDIYSLENPLETKTVHDYMFGKEERVQKLEFEIALLQKYLLSIVDNEQLIEYINTGLSTDNFKTKKWGVKTWTEWNFELLPMITTILNLELLKQNVLIIEGEVIESQSSLSFRN